MRKYIPDAIDTKDAATIVGVTARRIRYMAESGRLIAVKLGRDWLISRASVEAYLASRAAKKGER